MSSRIQTWAAIVEHPGADPYRDRVELLSPTVRTLFVPVDSAAQAPATAAALADEGATLIELCGGMTPADVAAVRAALPDHVAVGHVTFAVDSLASVAEHARIASGDA